MDSKFLNLMGDEDESIIACLWGMIKFFLSGGVFQRNTEYLKKYRILLKYCILSVIFILWI